MKKSLGILGGMILSFVAINATAQIDSTKKMEPVQQQVPAKTDTVTPQPVQQTMPATTQPVTTNQPATTSVPATTDRWDPINNPTVSAIHDKYKDKYIAPKTTTITSEQIFPVLGKYESSTNADAASVTISLDPENKGMVWIEGVPQGKIKAMLRKSPSTYKIPAQTTEDGKEVGEGTAIFDKETNTLSMVIGKDYNAADPMAAFAPEATTEETVVTTQDVPADKVVVRKDKNKTKLKDKKAKTEVVKVKPWMYTGTKVETTIATTTTPSNQ